MQYQSFRHLPGARYVFRFLSHRQISEIFFETHVCPNCTAPTSLSLPFGLFNALWYRLAGFSHSRTSNKLDQGLSEWRHYRRSRQRALPSFSNCIRAIISRIRPASLKITEKFNQSKVYSIIPKSSSKNASRDDLSHQLFPSVRFNFPST